MFLLCARGQHPVDIAREHVDLDIELSALGQIAQASSRRAVCGMMLTEKCVPSSASRTSLTVSDTPSSVIEPFGAIAGASDAVDANADPAGIAFGADADHFADAVDMAGDDMPAELVAHAQRALEVEPGAFAPHVLRRSATRFRRKRRPRTSRRPCRRRSGRRPSRRSRRPGRRSRGRSRCGCAGGGRRAARR